MTEAEIRERIESLVAEEHQLLGHRSESGLDPEQHARLEAVMLELEREWDRLRRVQAGMPEDLADADVPDPPNDLDGPDPEPLHLDHGLHADGPSPDPGISPNAP